MFISTVAICIYMFNKRRYDLLLAVVALILTAAEMLEGCELGRCPPAADVTAGLTVKGG